MKTSIISLTSLLLKHIKLITVLRSGGEHRGHRYYLNDVEPMTEINDYLKPNDTEKMDMLFRARCASANLCYV